MIEFKKLSHSDYEKYYNKVALMNTLVFEELHHFAGEETPQECVADSIMSPKDKYHARYFRGCKKAAIEIANKCANNLYTYDLSAADKIALENIINRITDAKDSVELTWAGMQLRNNISPYIRDGRFITPNLVA